MPTPSPRNSIRIARGNIADLQASVSDIGEGELCFAIDENRFYSKSSGALVPVGGGTELTSIDQMGDVDVTTVAPLNGQVLSWDGTNWIPSSSSGAPVDSVNGQTGIVVLDADNIDDTATTNKFTTASDISKLAGIAPGAEVNVNADWNAGSGDAQILNKPTLGTAAAADTTDFATAAQGATADSALQPGDNVSTLTNDAGYITAAGAPGTDLSYTASTRVLASSTGADTTLPEVVASGDPGLITGADKAKLDGIASGAQVNTVDSVAGKTGAVSLVKGDVGLGNVDNTSDADKPVSTAQQTALDAKADLVGGVVPNSQLPALAITEYLGTAADQTAMLALSGQRGDWAIRTDTSTTWVITTDGGSNLSDWTELATPADAVSSVNGYQGTVVLSAADVGAATTAQGALADSAIQPTDSIDALADVDTTTAAPTNGQFLQYNGSNWVPGSPSGVTVNLGYTTAASTGTVTNDSGTDATIPAATTSLAGLLTGADKAKLDGIAAGAEVNTVDSVAGKTGAVSLVKADITNFSDADYATAAQGALADSALQSADIGVTVQAYDADNVVSDTAPTFTATVQTTERTITAGAFNLATGNHWTCGAITVPAPTNATAATSGLIRITAGPVVWNAVFKFPGGSAPVIATFPAVIPFYVESASVILMGNVAEGIA